MLSKLHDWLDRFGVFLSGFQLRRSARRARPRVYANERPWEYSFVLEQLQTHGAMRVLDVGSGTNAFSAVLEHCGYNVTASDLQGAYWGRFQNRHIFVERDDITASGFGDSAFDATTCISTLEHIEDFRKAVGEMVRVTKPGGIILLTFPFTVHEFVENVYRLPEADAMSSGFRYIARSFAPQQVSSWCDQFDLAVVATRYIRGWEGKYWRTGKRIKHPALVTDPDIANCACFALRVNKAPIAHDH